MASATGPIHLAIDGLSLAVHEAATQRWVAARLAALIDGRDRYLVPSHTLATTQAHALGIDSALDFYGGAVPYPYVGTKVITHAAREGGATPAGWQPAFPRHVAGVVLPGHSAFDAGDLEQVALALLRAGPIRLKTASGKGGRGQLVVRQACDLDAALALFGPFATPTDGVVVEHDLARPVTLSVGQVRLPALDFCYLGWQRETHDPSGAAVYGGSTLLCVAGGPEALLAVLDDPDERRAVAQAQTYHAAALADFDGLMLSRANYDVIQGFDMDGQWRSGVLEQSWRIGGASPAEAVAAGMLAHDPSRPVRVACEESYVSGAALPDDAQLVFRAGADAPANEPALKFVRVLAP